MQTIDQLIPLVYVVMMLMMWLFPPRWVSKMIGNLESWFSELKTWGGRFVGAAKHGTTEETKALAIQSDNPIVQGLTLLTEFMPIIEKLPAILQVVDQLGNSDLSGLGKILGGIAPAVEGQVNQEERVGVF